MYPSLENKIISGAFFKPPIDTLPEKFFYATKDYCVEKEDIDELSCNLFISQFNEQQEYDLTIYMSKPEMVIEVDLETKNGQFGSLENYLDFDLNSGNLKLTEQGINLIKNNEQYIEDYLSLWPEDYNIKVIIPNTKEFWNDYYHLSSSITSSTPTFTFQEFNFPTTSPNLVETITKNPTTGEESIDVSIESQTFQTNFIVSGGLYDGESNCIIPLYNITVIPLEDWYNKDTVVNCRLEITLGNKKFTQLENFYFDLEEPFNHQYEIIDFSDGTYTVKTPETLFSLKSFYENPSSEIGYITEDNKVIKIEWQEVSL